MLRKTEKECKILLGTPKTFFRAVELVKKRRKFPTLSVADPDPGYGAFLTPGSRIRNRFFPDPGSQTHIFESLVTIFWAKSSIIL